MPLLTADQSAPLLAERSLSRSIVLRQVRAALAMITDDPAARALAGDTATTPDVTAPLTDWLYARWWCGPARVGSAPPDGAEAARGAARLEAGRRTVAARSEGWLVLASAAGRLVAARLSHTDRSPARAERRVTTTDDAVLTSSRPGLPPRPGDLVTLLHGEAGLDRSGGWWWAHSGRPDDLGSGPLDRWYVHARDLSAATELVPLLLAAVAEAGCDVSIKCPPTRAGYGRRDALVVYLPRDHVPAAEAALRRRADALAVLVEPDAPPLTRPLLPGVGQAQDPGAERGPVSYGQLRCSQVAALAARQHDRVLASDGLDDAELVAELAGLGIDVDAAHRVLG